MDATATKQKAGFKRGLRTRWYVLWPMTAALLLYPINNFVTRTATLFAFAGLYFGLVYFYWDKKIIRYGALLMAAVCALFFLSPSRSVPTDALRKKYIDSLAAYAGTKYVWGGENRIGIDCSGLVRRGLTVAEFKEGIVAFNSGLTRESVALWWNDCSARALGEEYQHRTRLMFSSPSINQLDHSRILPGDIAVTANGVHVLAYLGDRVWIEADPSEQKVIRVQVPSRNPWFNEPINILRWTVLDNQ